MDENQFAVISAKLDSILKLLALNAVKGMQLKEQVGLLSSIGFPPKQIADMLGKTPNHVSVILHDLRKKAVAEEEQTQRPVEQEGARIG